MKSFTKVVSLLLIAASVVSCDKHKPEPPMLSGSATVTFKPVTEGRYYMKVEDNLAFVPLNSRLKDYPFQKKVEHRALISYLMDPDQKIEAIPGFENTLGVIVMQIDTIRTKDPIVYDPAKEAEYGNDPIGLYLGGNVFPTTLIEDGYLNVFYNIGVDQVQIDVPLHELNLLTGVNPEDPYEVELRHNAHGDAARQESRGLVDFCLKNLPDTEGKTVKLTLKWNSSVAGKVQSVQFDYRSRTDW